MEVEQKEQLIRTVSQIGNGAHIFAPKEWINEKVLIVRLEKKTIKEKLIEKISPYLDKIIAVLLFGSVAREEETEQSDIDVLIIAKEKFKIEKEKEMDIIILTDKEIPESIKKNPILMYSIFKESKTIINPEYAEEFKKIKIIPRYFSEFIEQTKKSIRSDKEIIELDRKTGKYASDSIVYSLILRLRGIYIINCLLDKKDFSNSSFKNWLNQTKVNFSNAYDSYKRIRSEIYGKESKIKILESEKLLTLLESELNKLESKINQ